jgi:type IV secretion system protein VirB8
MTPEARAEADAHYRDAASWANDRAEALHASRRTAWIIALVAVGVALCLAIALMLLVPLKTSVPYTLLVDRQTGHVQALKPIEAERIAPDAALTQSFLVQYVLAREGFDRATVEADYRKVALWSAGTAGSDYVARMQVSHPDSPLVRLPRGSVIDAHVRSVSALNLGTAMVRFETRERRRAGAPGEAQAWVAIITYRYSNDPLSIEDRYINPLGFQVTRYRRNAETLPMTSEASPEPQQRRAEAALGARPVRVDPAVLPPPPLTPGGTSTR